MLGILRILANRRLIVPFKGLLDQFLLFGDSLTQFSCSQEKGFAFHAALQDAYMRRLDVINRGFSGYTSAQGLVALPSFMPKPEQARLRFMAVFFGANDACLAGSQSGQHVTLREYKQNLKNILNHPSVTAQKPRLILITPPPVDEHRTVLLDEMKGYVPASRSAEHTKQYAHACRDVGLELGVKVLDLWSIFMAKAGWKEGQPLPGSEEAPPSEILQKLLSDGLHFNPAAYEIMYKSMMDLIRREFPDQDPDTLLSVLPAWTEAPKS